MAVMVVFPVGVAEVAEMARTPLLGVMVVQEVEVKLEFILGKKLKLW
jgi:hypothetical protein